MSCSGLAQPSNPIRSRKQLFFPPPLSLRLPLSISLRGIIPRLVPQRAGDYAAEVGPSLFTSRASMNLLIFQSTGVRKMQPTLSDKITTESFMPPKLIFTLALLFPFSFSRLLASSPLEPCFTCSVSCATAAGGGSLTAVRASAERRPLPTHPSPTSSAVCCALRPEVPGVTTSF